MHPIHHPPPSSCSSLSSPPTCRGVFARRRGGGGRGATSPTSLLLSARAISTSQTLRPPSLIARAINNEALILSTTPRRRPSNRPATLRAAASSSASSPAPSADATDASPTPTTCWKLLRDFSAAEFRRQARPWVDTPEKRARLRDALMTVYRQPAPAESGFGWSGVAAADNANASSSSSSPPADVIVGVTASDARVAIRALRDWCAALGLPYVQPEGRLGGGRANNANANANATASTAPAPSLAALPPGPVYVKYAPAGGVCYASPYTGPDRGVLLQLGQAPLLGHFPLGLMEDASSPAAAA